MKNSININTTQQEEIENTFVGIDIAKDDLVVHILPMNQQLTVPNSPKGFRQLIKLFKDNPPKQIVCEATGGLERLLVAHLAAEGFSIIIANPRQVRKLAEGLGQLAKNDAADARLLARIAQMQHFTPRPLPPQEIQDMNDLVQRRQQLIEMRTQEMNRQHQAMQKFIKKSIEKQIALLNKQIDVIDALIRSMIESNEDWSEKDKIIQSVPGIGPRTSQVLISALPELGGELDRQEIAALAGVAPYDQDSGKKHGKRRIRGGRSNVRSALYMAAFNVVRQKGKFKNFFEGLLARGKSYKVAMVAVMRKLLSTLNVMLKTKTTWRENAM